MDDKAIKYEFDRLRDKIGALKKDVELEEKDDYAAAEILSRLIEEKPVSQAQITFLKEQSIDFTKVLALVGLQAVPGSSVAIILLEKLAKKNGFSLFPNPDRKIPKIE